MFRPGCCGAGDDLEDSQVSPFVHTNVPYAEYTDGIPDRRWWLAYSGPMLEGRARLVERVRGWNAFVVLRHADFRLLWIGSLFSFIGTQIQNVAQGYFVFELTGSNFQLALVSFCSMFPITLIGPFAAVLADLVDRRMILVFASIVYAVSAGFLAIATFGGFIQYWHFLVAALAGGLMQVVEQPTRQSVVRTVVPREDLSSAIPVQGMTFNLARTVGPAVGGVLTGLMGPAFCFAVNAFSYMAILVAVLRIKADLTSPKREAQPIKDLIFEGMLYTFRHKGLTTLFLMEGTTSLFGIFYLAQMPAVAKDLLGLDAKGLGLAYSSVGIGALAGLIALSSLARKRFKPQVIRLAMTSFSVLMFLLSTIHVPWLAYPVLGLMGACTIAQFNTTNTLFQLIAPMRLQGRVLAMHMWAVAGLAPLSALLFGSLADAFGLRRAMVFGAAMIMAGAIFGWIRGRHVMEPEDEEEEESGAA